MNDSDLRLASFMPIIVAGVLMIAALCGFIAADFERIVDAVATSEARV